MKPPARRLPPDLHALAARLIVERLRPVQWQAARDLRHELAGRVLAGADIATLAAELQHAIVQTSKANKRRTQA